MTKMILAFSLLILMSGFSSSLASSSETEETLADSQSGVLTTPDGEIIGAVVDFIFDLKANHILYVAGVLHTSEEFKNRVLIFPWSAVQVNLELNSFVLTEDKTMFKEAPSFSADAWPSLPTAQWKTAINAALKEKRNAHFATLPASDLVLARANDLIGKTVKTAKGEDVGALAELLVDPEQGSIAYAIISFDDSGNNSHLLFYSLPWTTVQADPVQLTFVVPDFVKDELHTPSLSPLDRKPALEIFALREMSDRTS
ncbi:MAG: PRC-barrel domain-containing protein [Candidatus Binatia bacterium]